jgi:hypothetical protein
MFGSGNILEYTKKMAEMVKMEVSYLRFYLLKIFVIKISNHHLDLQVNTLLPTMSHLLQSHVNKLSKLTEVGFYSGNSDLKQLSPLCAFSTRTCKITEK